MRGTRCDRRVAQYSAHQEAIIIVNIGNEDDEKIVPVPRHRIAFDNLVTFFNETFERRYVFSCMALHANIAEYMYPAPNLARVDKPHMCSKDASRLKRTNAPPARST